MTRQEKINDLLNEIKKGNNWNPNLTSIGKAIEMPVSSVHDLVKKLQSKGALTITVSVKLDRKKLEEKRLVI